MKALVTRPGAQGERLAADLAAQGWTPVLCPLMEFEPLGPAPDIAGVAAVVFTSANGVRALAGRAPASGPAFAVGAATAAAARKVGFSPVRSADGDWRDLAALLIREAPPGDLLHVRGEHGAGDLSGALAAAGLRLREAVLYRMAPAGSLTGPARAALEAGEIAAAPFYSPRTARIFARLASGANLSATVALAISAAAAAPLAPLGFARVETAAAPDGRAMLAAMARIGAEFARGTP